MQTLCPLICIYFYKKLSSVHRFIVHGSLYNAGGLLICAMFLIDMCSIKIRLMALLQAITYMYHHGSFFCERRMEVVGTFIIGIVITVGTKDLRGTCSDHMQIGFLGHGLELLDFLLKGCCTLLHGGSLIKALGAHLQDLNGSFPPKVLRIRNYSFV